MSVDIWFHGAHLRREDDFFDEALQAVSALGEWTLNGGALSSDDATFLLARWWREDPDALRTGSGDALL